MSNEDNGGGILFFDHLNLSIQDDSTDESSTGRFYLQALAMHRDRRGNCLHATMGLTQIHLLPEKDHPSQILDGHIGLYFPDLDQLQHHLSSLQAEQSTPLDFRMTVRNINTESDEDESNYLEIQGIHGNEFRCYATPQGYVDKCMRLGTRPTPVSLGAGIAYVAFHCPPASLEGLAAFYTTYFDARVELRETSRELVVHCGDLNQLRFREHGECVQVQRNDDVQPESHAYHICIIVRDFQATFEKLLRANLVYVNPKFKDRANAWVSAQAAQQFRILNLRHPVTNALVMQLEHEIRSISHPRCPLIFHE